MIQYRNFLTTPATKTMPVCFQSPADWANAIKGMEDAKVIPAGTKPADYFTNDYIDLNYANTVVF